MKAGSGASLTDYPDCLIVINPLPAPIQTLGNSEI